MTIFFMGQPSIRATAQAETDRSAHRAITQNAANRKSKPPPILLLIFFLVASRAWNPALGSCCRGNLHPICFMAAAGALELHDDGIAAFRRATVSSIADMHQSARLAAWLGAE